MHADTVNRDPPWLRIARDYLGLREIPGPGNHPVISRWLGTLGGWWADDATPWCGTFVAACLVEAGLPKPEHWYRAKAYLDYGARLGAADPGAPYYGAIVIYARSGGGHVGFVIGQDELGRIMTLGGNQSDAVSIAPFDRSRVLGYRWPPSVAHFPSLPLPRISSAAASSSHEA